MIFTNEPMAFQTYIIELLKLIQLKEIIIKEENVILTKHCYHSNDYQDFKICAKFEPCAFMIYEYNITRELTDNEKDIIKKLSLDELPETVNEDSVHGKELTICVKC